MTEHTIICDLNDHHNIDAEVVGWGENASISFYDEDDLVEGIVAHSKGDLLFREFDQECSDIAGEAILKDVATVEVPENEYNTILRFFKKYGIKGDR